MQEKFDENPKAYARTVDGAAKSIGISRAGLYRLIGAKALRTFKIGKRTLIAESELQRFVAERIEAAA